MHPARVIAELRRAAPRNSVLVVDSGAHTFFTGHNWASYAPNEFLFLSTTGPMGYGVAMGIGAKLARPDQPCVCVVGDGSLLMHGMEIHTAVRYNVPLVIVVINNSALGNVYLRARKAGPAATQLAEIPTQNWANFARSLGADGVVVEQPSQLAAAFKQAFAANKPFLIDARCDRNCNTPNTQEAA
jgi:acetolactate synthase-1/2/3 large subunit